MSHYCLVFRRLPFASFSVWRSPQPFVEKRKVFPPPICEYTQVVNSFACFNGYITCQSKIGAKIWRDGMNGSE